MDSAGPTSKNSSATMRIRDDAIKKKHQEEVNALENKIGRLKRANDEINRQLFTVENNGRDLANALGFRSMSQATAALAAADEVVSFSEWSSRLAELHSDIKNLKDEKDTLSDKLKDIEVQTSCTCEHNDSCSEHALHLALQKRYDELLELKQRAGLAYKKDYQKWKSFRSWLIADELEHEVLSKGASPSQRKRLREESKKRKLLKLEELGPNLEPVATILVASSSSPVKEDTSDKENQVTPQAMVRAPALALPSPLSGKKYHSLFGAGTVRPCSKPRQTAPKTFDPAPLKLGVIELDSSDNEDRSLPSKPSSSEINSNRRRSDMGVISEGSPQPRKKRRVSDVNGSESGNEQINTIPVASTVKTLTDYSIYKGRGRYAKDLKSDNQSINKLFEIDRNKNAGLDYPFEEVVRNKDQRKKMHATDCECCHDYYEAIGPMPPRLQAPLWRSPSSSPSRTHRHSVASHKKAISRHRESWNRPKTPPGYWNIGFPSTQEAKEINEKAAIMHEQKQAAIAAEAGRQDGRYKRR